MLSQKENEFTPPLLERSPQTKRDFGKTSTEIQHKSGSRLKEARERREKRKRREEKE